MPARKTPQQTASNTVSTTARTGGRASEGIEEALWRIYRRPGRPQSWSDGGNLPWDDTEFSRAMLAEHLDDRHGAASRRTAERALQIDWLWRELALQAGTRVLDLTCGPGLYAVELAKRGCQVTGIDFSPASVDYARQIAADAGVSADCRFELGDIRDAPFGNHPFDTAILLYGQLAVFPVDEAGEILRRVAGALRPGGRLVVELLAAEHVDTSDGSWWFTDNRGLWGDRPYLHLGERFWNAAEEVSTERYQIIDLESGTHREIHLCDQRYSCERFAELLAANGFSAPAIHPGWGGLALYDARTWTVYVAEVSRARPSAASDPR